MNSFEFIKYEPTPEEKHLGVATVKLYGKIIARFKIIPSKDGTSFFPVAPSIKLGETYMSGFTLDSMSEKEELDAIIKVNVRKCMAPQSAPQETAQPQNQMEFNFGEPPF